MKSLSSKLFCLALLLFPVMGHAADSAVTLYMPDGQLQTHLVRVFITASITREMHPVLKLHTSHAFTAGDAKEDGLYRPTVIDEGHTWERMVDGNALHPTGTLLLFDLNDFPIPDYKAVIRVLPELIWQGADGRQLSAVGNREIYLANPIGTYLWSVGTAGLLFMVIAWLAKKGNGRAIALLCEPNGKLSLSKTQMTLWTVAIGGVVFAFGLIKLDIPDIPDTLLMLMGASLLTTGVSQFKGMEATAKGTAVPVAPRIYQLVSEPATSAAAPNLSLARAQMLFWTVLTVILFISKSILDGVMWDVPVELVALMGMSQLTYLAPKLKQ